MPSFGPDDVAEALDAVSDAMEWTLAPSRWTEVDRSVVALTSALTAGDARALRREIEMLELLGPVRRSVSGGGGTAVRAPEDVLTHGLAAIGLLKRLQAPERAGPRLLPVAIYLSDESIHEQVEAAVDRLLRSAGLHIAEREEPLSGSWFRRMRAGLNSPTAREAALTAAHAAGSGSVPRPDAEVTAIFLQNLGPVIAALQPTRDAVIRAGALLVVKVDWTVTAHQLTPRQQLVLDEAPDLEMAPRKILPALGLASAAAGVTISGDPGTP